LLVLLLVLVVAGLAVVPSSSVQAVAA
jgi:hypothetical protein